MKEAKENLEEVRVMLIEHFLEHGLRVPNPVFSLESDSTEVDELDINIEGQDLEYEYHFSGESDKVEPSQKAFIRTQ
jgi:hypothetical protein